MSMGTHGSSPARERALLEAARRDDGVAFGHLVEPYRAELHAHCYRMLGPVVVGEGTHAFQASRRFRFDVSTYASWMVRRT